LSLTEVQSLPFLSAAIKSINELAALLTE
jgi:hypothetical protein